MQLYAMTTGSALTAGITMAVFAIGTAPGLLAVAGLPRIGSAAVRQQVLAITGAVLVAFAVVNAGGAAGLLGWTQRTAEVPTAITGNVSVGTDFQTVTMEQTTRGYLPQTTVVKPSLPIRWEITSVSDLSCAAYMRGVSWEWRTNLRTGANVVTLAAARGGRALRLRLRHGHVQRLPRRRRRLTPPSITGPWGWPGSAGGVEAHGAVDDAVALEQGDGVDSGLEQARPLLADPGLGVRLAREAVDGVGRGQRDDVARGVLVAPGPGRVAHRVTPGGSGRR